MTDVLAVLDRLDAMLSEDVTAAFTAPDSSARRHMHPYAAARLEKAVSLVLTLLPVPDAVQWLAMRRAALSPKGLAVIGRV